jgi:hypothetical protein
MDTEGEVDMDLDTDLDADTNAALLGHETAGSLRY